NHPTQHHWHEMNRKQRREMLRKIQSEDLSLEVIHPDAAGIDIGNESHYAAVPPSRDSQPVREFRCTTAELKAMAAWLQQCRIRTVAMQSTGVYWVAVYDILEEAGLEVYLVNARDTKNLPGRKSDVQESQWLLKLHTYGLLRNSFHPAAAIRVIRTYWRQRGDHVRAISTSIQRMQKTLTQMNIQLANVISDLRGWTGMRIVRATPKRRRKAGSHAPQFDLSRELHRISGVDLTRIDGVDVGVAQTLISEVGLDMSRWQDEHHFASWLGLCPDNRITGGKVIRRGTRHVINRAATAL